MLPFQFPQSVTAAQLQTYMLQLSQISQMSQLSQANQAGSSQLYNPMLMNQFLLSQQIQAMLMMPQMIQPKVGPKLSDRTIPSNEQLEVKQEELLDSPTKLLTSYSEDNHKLFDIEVITQELKSLIKYLSQDENPSQQYIEENFKTLPKVNIQLIPIIMERHMSQKKTKEEQIKFVLRKCSKFLKNKLEINQIIITPLEMEKRFYKEYFDGEEEMIPFREKSNMKTMNSQYLKKIFQSPKYVAGFKEYLGIQFFIKSSENFEKIWNEENEEKVDNMVKQVLKLIQQKRIEKLCTYRRIPWIVSIRENCKQLGLSMLAYAPGQDVTQLRKQVKLNGQEIKVTIGDQHINAQVDQ